MLVHDGESPVEGAGSFRHLLDLRNESLRHHGLDIRTETFQGGVVEAIRERLDESEEPTMLVIGLTSPERCSALIDELRELIREKPPAALLFVSGREERDARAAPAPVYAFAL
jgi:arginine utilization protein RocB